MRRYRVSIMERVFRDIKWFSRLSKTVRVLNFTQKALCVAAVALAVCEGVCLVKQLTE